MFDFLIQQAHAQGLADMGAKLSSVAGGAGYQETDYKVIIGLIIQSLLGLLGVIFFVLMLNAGYLWMTAQGNEQRLEKAKNIMTTSVIGLIIVLSSYAISYFVLSALQGEVLG